jgi:hypothetical protein
MKDNTIEELVKTHVSDIKELYIEKNVFGGQKAVKITFKDAKLSEKQIGFCVGKKGGKI